MFGPTTLEKVGSLVGGGFGLAFVVANSGSLPDAVALTLRVLAVVLFAVVAVRAVTARPPSARRPSTPPEAGDGPRPDRGFLLIATIEFAAIFGGVAVLRALDAGEGGVAWVCTVVGAHFLALARHWDEALFGWLGATMTPLGVAGLVLTAAGASTASVDLVAAIVPGLLLLTAALWGVGVRPRQFC